MRQLVVEVPAGELANLEKITLIEVRSAPVTKEKKRRMKISLVATAFEAKTKLVPQDSANRRWEKHSVYCRDVLTLHRMASSSK